MLLIHIPSTFQSVHSHTFPAHFCPLINVLRIKNERCLLFHLLSFRKSLTNSSILFPIVTMPHSFRSLLPSILIQTTSWSMTFFNNSSIMLPPIPFSAHNRSMNFLFQTFLESPASSTFFDLMLKAVKGNGKRFSLVGDMEIDDEINRFRDMNTDVIIINHFINELELWNYRKGRDWKDPELQARERFTFGAGGWRCIWIRLEM